MIASPNSQPLTPQEYLEWEEQQPIKYEYINGEVFAMTGGTLPIYLLYEDVEFLQT